VKPTPARLWPELCDKGSAEASGKSISVWRNLKAENSGRGSQPLPLNGNDVCPRKWVTDNCCGFRFRFVVDGLNEHGLPKKGLLNFDPLGLRASSLCNFTFQTSFHTDSRDGY